MTQKGNLVRFKDSKSVNSLVLPTMMKEEELC